VYIEELSDGYWLTELQVAEWDEEYAVMDTADHSALAEFVYGCDDHPLLIKERRNTSRHLPVYPEESIPADTVVVPSDGKASFEVDTEEVLVVKNDHAVRMFMLIGM
jgi:hypothetical protein